MSKLLEQIKKDKLEYRKVKNTQITNLLSVVEAESSKQLKKSIDILTDIQVISTIKKMIENLKLVGDSNSLIEIEYLTKYLPQLMNESEIKDKIIEISTKLNTKELPKIMKEFQSLFNGKADNKIVIELIKQL